jgi:flavodoxin I
MIGLFYGSTNGSTAAVAELIRATFAEQHGIDVELLDVADTYLEEMVDFDALVLGVPTWNTGQLQRDWEAVLDEFDAVDLTGKRAAVFGVGDQIGYPGTFADAMIFLAERLEAQGAVLAGAWPVDGYHFTQSWAVRDGRFVGLVVDEENQPELTRPRVQAWVRQLAAEFAGAAQAAPRGA